MGFNLIIGEATADGEHAKIRRLKNAPADGVPTDYTNQRWPSYTGWTDFYNTVGLKDLFERRILRDHPGFVLLQQSDKDEIDRAYQSIKLFPAEHQVRLEWLKFWVEWALTNCEKPIFYNS